jgi:hypothetical protein
LARLEIAHACERAGGDHRRHRGREDEAGSEAPDAVDERGRARDVTADDSEPLGKGALDDGDPVERAIVLGDPPSARSVEADRVYLVKIGQCVVALRHVAEGVNGGDVAVHRVDGLEADELRPVRVDRAQKAVEIRGIAVPENLFLGAAPPDSLDHRSVVHLIREDDAAGEQPRDCADGPLVCRIS